MLGQFTENRDPTLQLYRCSRSSHKSVTVRGGGNRFDVVNYQDLFEPRADNEAVTRDVRCLVRSRDTMAS